MLSLTSCAIGTDENGDTCYIWDLGDGRDCSYPEPPPAQPCDPYGSYCIDNHETQQDISRIQGLKALSTLHILETKLFDLSFLKDVEQIGLLYVIGNSDLSSLSGLSNVKQASTIVISDNPVLRSLQGLDGITFDNLDISDNYNLTTIPTLENQTAGNISVSGNFRLTNLEFLANLTNVTENLNISDNRNLVDLRGLEQLQESRDLTFVQNYNLVSLNGLNPNILYDTLTIKNNVSLQSAPLLNNTSTVFITISGNPNLANLDFLSNVAVITQGISIYDNDSIFDLFGLGSLVQAGEIVVESNLNLENISALNPELLFDTLHILSNPNLSSLTNFNITQADTIEISHNTSLLDLGTFPHLGILNTFLIIQDNPLIKDLSGFSSISSVSRMRLIDNSSLANLDGLISLSSLDYLDVVRNESLANLGGLKSITKLLNLSIGVNNSLQNLAGLESLQDVNSLSIDNNSGLTTFDGLNPDVKFDSLYLRLSEKLEKLNPLTNPIAKIVTIVNSSLLDLSFLSNLESVEYLNIFGNKKLTTLGLTALTTVSSGLSIEQNELLCESVANEVYDQLNLAPSEWYKNIGNAPC